MKSIFFCILFSFNCVVSIAKADLPSTLPPGNYSTTDSQKPPVSKETRMEALSYAQVLQESTTPINQVDLSVTQGDGPFKADDEVVCKCVNREWGSGKTPKFYCSLPNGKIIKAKYKKDNKEIPSEVVGTRLLRALGFGADEVYMPKAVRCFGCNKDPYKKLCESDTQYVDFDPVTVEVKLAGSNLESKDGEGWKFSELSQISEAAGGAPQDHISALHLLVAFLQHGDTKAANQRLICLPGGMNPERTRCVPSYAFAYMQDLGAMFGGESGIKFNLGGWSKGAQIWASLDCTVKQPMSFSSPTFPQSVKITEGGRRLLFDRLSLLDRQQIEGLFRGVRLPESEVKAWADVFQKRVRMLNANNLRCSDKR